MDYNSKDDLKDFITLSKERLKAILKRLEWSEEEVLKDFNSNSVASSKKEKIKKICSPKIASYPDSCITQNSIVLETNKLQEILENPEVQAPVNFTQLQANFTREQKLKIYDYVIGNTEKLQHFKDTPVVEGELSLADILAQKKREDKRKKRRFRKSKPTHIEEVRGLVELQMQALQQFMTDKIKKEERVKKDNYARDRREDESNRNKEYYNKGRNRERLANDFRESHNKERRRRSRSRSKEKIELHKRCHREIIYKRSRSRDISTGKSRRDRSRSKNRSRSRSRNKMDSYRSRKRSRSRTKNDSKDRRKRSKSQSKERYSQRNKYDYFQKQRSSRDYDCFYEKDQEKSTYKEKHYRRYNESPGTSNSKKYYQEDTSTKEYYNERNSTKSSSYNNYDGYHKSLSLNRAESPQNKHSKHKKKKT